MGSSYQGTIYPSGETTLVTTVMASEEDVNFDRNRLRRTRKCSACLGQGHDIENYTNDSSRLTESTESLSSKDGHCHDSKLPPDIDKKARRKLIIAIILSFFFMIAEIIGGIFAHSLAIVSDAAHLLTDLASFLISLLAVYLASRRATQKLSFGWDRAEILGALVSILFLWVITGVLCYMAVERVLDRTFEVNAEIMLITAGCGVAFNLVMGFSLHPGGHGHSHGNSHDESNYNSFDDEEEKVGLIQSESVRIPSERGSGDYGAISQEVKVVNKHSHKGGNLNVKAAFIHVIGDLLQSIGVLVAAIIIYFKPEWKLADPICTFLFSVIVLVTTLTVMRDILVVLMEGAPRGVSFKAIYDSLRRVPCVEDLHDLRVWSLSMNKAALSVHIAVKKTSDPFHVLQQATSMIEQKYRITDITIQVEEYSPVMLDCTHCKDLPG